MLRVHLAPGQRVSRVQAMQVGWVPWYTNEVETVSVRHLTATAESEAGAFTPFGGKGSRPAPQAGPIAELTLAASAKARTVHLTLVAGL